MVQRERHFAQGYSKIYVQGPQRQSGYFERWHGIVLQAEGERYGLSVAVKLLASDEVWEILVRETVHQALEFDPCDFAKASVRSDQTPRRDGVGELADHVSRQRIRPIGGLRGDGDVS